MVLTKVWMFASGKEGGRYNWEDRHGGVGGRGVAYAL